MKEKETIRDDVRVGDCFLDPAYSRPLNDRHAEMIASEWKDNSAGVIYVSMRDDGRFAVLDGAHRVAAYRSLHGDDARLPAKIYIDLSPREEAALWSDYNKKRRAPTPADVFRSDLAAGDQEALAINNILETLDLHFSLDQGPKDKGIQAISAVRKMYRQYNAAMVVRVLGIISAAQGDGQGAIQGFMINGLAAFMDRYRQHQDYNEDHLLGVLNTHSPAQIRSLAHTICATTPTSAESAIGMAILEVYNRGMRKKALPPWQMRGPLSTAEVERRRAHMQEVVIPARIASAQRRRAGA